MSLRAYLIDDEALAIKRLSRLLLATGRAEIVGASTDSVAALEELSTQRPDTLDVLFLDIQMPGLNGFEFLSRLPWQPLVVFTTAFDQYALQAFEVNSIDYLVKPVDSQLLDRALSKLERMRGGSSQDRSGQDLRGIVEQLAASLRAPRQEFPNRIASRTGSRVQFLDLDRVTHFFAKDKLTYASTQSKTYIVDGSIADLEQRLDPRKFVRIHRAVLLNIAYVHEVDSWFAGRVLIRLRDEKHTELTVARDRVHALKGRLGF